MHDLWHQAAHDSTNWAFNYTLNRLPHAAAFDGLSCPSPLSLALLHLLPEHILLTYGEQVVLDVKQGLDELYEQAAQDKCFTRWHPASLRPTAREFVLLLQQGSLSAVMLKHSFALRAPF